MVATLSGYPILAVDTESNSLFAYREQVCLIQFSTPETDYLVDPLSLTDLSILGPIFADPGVEKIFHAAEYDVICLKRDFGFSFAGIFDTMVAARVLGRPAVGLGSILEEEFGVSLDKRYQRANWGLRPLPPAQLSYARLDTHYLISLRALLKSDLVETGRWPLAEEDFRRLASAGNGAGHNGENGHDTLWRISGIQDLAPHQVAVLQQLNQYRDQQARASNRPPFKVLSNQALVEIAQACPTSLADFSTLSEVNDRLVDRYGRDLLRAVRAGLASPPPVRPSYPRPDDRFLMRLEDLRTWRKKAASEMGVESDVVLPRDVMHEIASAEPRDLGDLEQVMRDLPYRASMFGEQILKAIH
jgi:ribonuclease D